jgi:hypothetical protein
VEITPNVGAIKLPVRLTERKGGKMNLKSGLPDILICRLPCPYCSKALRGSVEDDSFNAGGDILHERIEMRCEFCTKTVLLRIRVEAQKN